MNHNSRVCILLTAISIVLVTMLSTPALASSMMSIAYATGPTNDGYPYLAGVDAPNGDTTWLMDIDCPDCSCFEVVTLPTTVGPANEEATLNAEIISIPTGGNCTKVGFKYGTLLTNLTTWTDTGNFILGSSYSHYISGLTAGALYYARAFIGNATDTVYGEYVAFFAGGYAGNNTATICGVICYNFLAIPLSNTDIKLSWDWWPIGGNSSVVIDIYYGLQHYPVDRTDGTRVYIGNNTSATHTNLLPGTTYYYRAWLLCGGNYSADYVEDWATTYGSSPVVSPPEQPEGWFQDPNCRAYSQIPMLSDALAAVTTAYGFPATTVCVMFTLLWIIVLGLAVFLFIHSAMMMIITIAVLIILASIMGLLPLWMIVIAICLGGISIYISGRT